MIDRRALVVFSSKHHRLKVEVRAKAFQRDWVGSVALHRIGNTINMIEHHCASSLKIKPILLKAGIVDDILNTVIGFQHFKDVVTTLQTAIFCLHRKNRNVSTSMGGEPVVRENTIWKSRSISLKHMNAHTVRFKLLHHCSMLIISLLGVL